MAPADFPSALFIETDRDRIVYESNGTAWKWFSGRMTTTLGAGIAALALTLGANDTGLLAYSSAYDRTFQWSGSAFAEVDARDRSVHFFLEPPVTAGYAVCDGSSVLRSRPNGTIYSFTTPDLTGKFPKFGDVVGAHAAVAPTLDVTATIPVGALVHRHNVHLESDTAVNASEDAWEVIQSGDLAHRHNLTPDGTTHAHGIPGGSGFTDGPSATVDACAPFPPEFGAGEVTAASGSHTHGLSVSGGTSDNAGITGETESGMDEFSLAGDPHHHHINDVTEADMAEFTLDLDVTATAETDGEPANYVLKGYISL